MFFFLRKCIHFDGWEVARKPASQVFRNITRAYVWLVSVCLRRCVAGSVMRVALLSSEHWARLCAPVSHGNGSRKLRLNSC